MSLIKIGIGLIIVGIVLMYQGPFSNALGSIDELIEQPVYLIRTIVLPLVLILSGGFLIKKDSS